MAKQLAKVLRDAEDDSKSIAVTGPSDAKTAQVLTDAITLLKSKRLEHTSIIFVGSKAAASDLETKVISTGATFLFAEF